MKFLIRIFLAGLFYFTQIKKKTTEGTRCSVYCWEWNAEIVTTAFRLKRSDNSSCGFRLTAGSFVGGCTAVQTRFHSFVRSRPILSSNSLSDVVSRARLFVTFATLQAITKSVLDRFMTRRGGPYAFALRPTDSCGWMLLMQATLRLINFHIKCDYVLWKNNVRSRGTIYIVQLCWKCIEFIGIIVTIFIQCNKR